ncbi:MAG: Dihydropteroate synthase [Acidimicrobiales bacterium]|nr:Dihydropteroate synthase [Acidimicrobiales bacterium]
MILQLGSRRFDLTHRAVVIGVVTTSDPAASAVDGARREVERLVAAGADVVELAPAEPLASAEDELRLLIPVLEAVTAAVDVPLACATERADVLHAAVGAGAVAGDDPSGFADPHYLATAAELGATVLARHPGGGPQDPVGIVGYLAERARWAGEAGVPAERIVLDAGLDLGGPVDRVAARLVQLGRLAAVGYPTSASTVSTAAALRAASAISPGAPPRPASTSGSGPVPTSAPAAAPTSADGAAAVEREHLAATQALAIGAGCRVLRTTDVRVARRVRDVMAAILEARVA